MCVLMVGRVDFPVLDLDLGHMTVFGQQVVARAKA